MPELGNLMGPTGEKAPKAASGTGPSVLPAPKPVEKPAESNQPVDDSGCMDC
jgi:hypothetical protein